MWLVSTWLTYHSYLWLIYHWNPLGSMISPLQCHTPLSMLLTPCLLIHCTYPQLRDLHHWLDAIPPFHLHFCVFLLDDTSSCMITYTAQGSVPSMYLDSSESTEKASLELVNPPSTCTQTSPPRVPSLLESLPTSIWGDTTWVTSPHTASCWQVWV